jgi:hypothetical protein
MSHLRQLGLAQGDACPGEQLDGRRVLAGAHAAADALGAQDLDRLADGHGPAASPACT